MHFSKLGLIEPVAAAVAAKGYDMPTPVQERAIPAVLEGSDVIGCAQTGTGKTAAFALPIISRLAEHRRTPRALVLAPTRELALQVQESFETYAAGTDLRVVTIYGGVSIVPQKQAIQRGVDIMVATPGRMLDLLQQKAVVLRDVRFLVLDEADRMLDMGFLPTVRKIVGRCPRERQTLLFSATMPKEIQKLAEASMRSPVDIMIGRKHSPASTVTHAVYPVSDRQKLELLRALLHRKVQSAIVFCRTRHRANRVGEVLARNGFEIGVLHSDKSQAQREQVMGQFRAGKFNILVATDIASRGLDVLDVSHVINYDVPVDAEAYVHRIGRTGRADAKGEAYTLLVEEDSRRLESIERFIKKKIPVKLLPKFNYKQCALVEQKLNRSGGNKKQKTKRLRLNGERYVIRTG